MPRRSTISDDLILDSARVVFLEKGIRATTAEVARHAGIAEGSIFNRFRTKEALFRSSMRLSIEEPAWLGSLEERTGVGDVGENLIAVGHELIAFFRQIMPLMLMSWSNQCEWPASFKKHVPSPPIHALNGVARFFQAEMKRKRLRKSDASVLARMYIGAIQHYVFTEMITRGKDKFLTSERVFLRGLIDIMMTGASPKELRK